MDVKKRSLGIIGGMGAHASAWLFKRITELSDVEKDQEYLDVLLHNNSAIADRTRAITLNDTSPLPEMMRTVHIFNHSNVEVAIIACMTAHFYYDQLSQAFNGTLLSAADMVVHELFHNDRYTGKKKIGVIGSKGLLKSGLFQKKLTSIGCEMIILNDLELEKYFMNPIYGLNGIKSGKLHGETVSPFAMQIEVLQRKGAEVVVGACSEAPLIFTPDVVKESLFIDAFDLLARNAVMFCYSKEPKNAIPV